MLLAIDVGNTHIVIGLFREDEVIYNWRISTQAQKTADEIGPIILDMLERVQFTKDDIQGIVIGSVVPTLTESLFDMSRKYFNCHTLVVNARVKTSMPILMDNPNEVGADRIADGIAAYRLYGGPIIVVDFGTGTTFDYINAMGEYEGGVIAPGIGICIDALFNKAAKLSKVEYVKPPNVIGSNTVNSMQSGFYYGFAGQVDGILEKMMREMGTEDVKVVATGGYGRLVERESKYIQKVEPLLTLYGLKMIYEENV
ncbi:MAG: type III pantothenate kinase [Bacillota bacterium]|nr:type III pantothenate kinase [Bacillota bacterium]